MDLSLRDFELRKRRARGLFATQSAIFSASETRVRSAVNSNSVGTFPSGRSHSNPEGTSGQKAESLPKPRHGQSPLQKIETERILPNGPTSSSMDLSLRDFELRKPRARGLFATQSAIFSASETRVRRGWDSNPRGTFIPAGFQVRQNRVHQCPYQAIPYRSRSATDHISRRRTPPWWSRWWSEFRALIRP